MQASQLSCRQPGPGHGSPASALRAAGSSGTGGSCSSGRGALVVWTSAGRPHAAADLAASAGQRSAAHLRRRLDPRRAGARRRGGRARRALVEQPLCLRAGRRGCVSTMASGPQRSHIRNACSSAASLGQRSRRAPTPAVERADSRAPALLRSAPPAPAACPPAGRQPRRAQWRRAAALHSARGAAGRRAGLRGLVGKHAHAVQPQLQAIAQPGAPS